MKPCYVCMYVCMYVCTYFYVCMYIRIYYVVISSGEEILHLTIDLPLKSHKKRSSLITCE